MDILFLFINNFKLNFLNLKPLICIYILFIKNEYSNM